MSFSIRVIDSIYGQPAVGLSINFSRELEGAIADQWSDQTGEDGRISGLMASSRAHGSYILEIDLDSYFPTLGYASLFSAVSTRFRLSNEECHYELSIFITPASCFVLRAA